VSKNSVTLQSEIELAFLLPKEKPAFGIALAATNRRGLHEVELGLARRMWLWHEDLNRTLFIATDFFTKHRDVAHLRHYTFQE